VSVIKQFVIKGDLITLGQFLKEESLVGSGGQEKYFLQENDVLVNGELCRMRGKKLRPGDQVTVAGTEYVFA
jgi:ribosome-associated protein